MDLAYHCPKRVRLQQVSLLMTKSSPTVETFSPFSPMHVFHFGCTIQLNNINTACHSRLPCICSTTRIPENASPRPRSPENALRVSVGPEPEEPDLE